MKRICFFVTSYYVFENFLTDLTNKLISNYRVSIIGNFETDEILFMKEIGFEKVYNIPIKREIRFLNDIKTIFKIIKILKKEKFNIIHSISPKAGFFLAIFCFFFRKTNSVHTFTGQIWITKSGVFKSILKVIDRFISRRIKYNIVDSKSQLDFLIKNKIIKKKAFVFGNGSISGVNLKEFIRNQNNREFFRKSLKIADTDIIISYLGRINFDKGVIDLITSFKHLKCKYSNIKLFFFGSFEGEIFSIIQRKFGFKDIHFFSDKSFNKLDFYNITDIFCLPSHREGFGLVAIEASAMTIPIVCSDIYGLQDSVVDKITGIKFNVKSYSDLSLKLEILIKDESYRNWLGNNGRNFVERNFSSELIINEWIKFYKKI